MTIFSSRISRLALSLLVAALAPAACTGDVSAPSQGEDVASTRQALAPAPTHEWLFAEAGGTTAADAVAANAVTGTLGNSASLGGGALSLAANGAFDPSSYADFGTTAAAFGTSDFTIAHWYKTTFSGTDLGDILGNRVAPSHGQYLSARIFGTGHVEFSVDQDGGGTNFADAQTSATVNDGAWHHLAYVRQGATVTIYVDGVASGSGSAASGQPADVAGAGSASFRVGRRLGNCCSNFHTIPSAFQDLRIYGSALGPADVAALVAQSGPASCAFGAYDCSGQPANGCTSAVPCATGGRCAQGSGCASGVCSGGVCQAVEEWQCTTNCWSIDTTCRDQQGATLNACLTACGGDLACQNECVDAYDAGYAACDSSVGGCSSVCTGSCSDGVQDDGETGVDCGGPCAPCAP